MNETAPVPPHALAEGAVIGINCNSAEAGAMPGRDFQCAHEASSA